MLRMSTVTTAVVTAGVTVVVTGLLTNFFSPAKVEGVLQQLWTLPVAERVLFVVGLPAIPFGVVQGVRLLVHAVKGLIGWEYPPDRSAWFVVSRIGALVFITGATWIWARTMLNLGRYLMT